MDNKNKKNNRVVFNSFRHVDIQTSFTADGGDDDDEDDYRRRRRRQQDHYHNYEN